MCKYNLKKPVNYFFVVYISIPIMKQHGIVEKDNVKTKSMLECYFQM